MESSKLKLVHQRGFALLKRLALAACCQDSRISLRQFRLVVFGADACFHRHGSSSDEVGNWLPGASFEVALINSSFA
jgi:hypothetical protein